MTTPSETPPIKPAGVPAGPQRPFYRQIDFWLGFIGWYVVNGAVWWALMAQVNGKYSGGANIFILPANVLVLLIATFVRRRFAGGLLTAAAINLFIAVLVGGTFLNIYCGVPFFVDIDVIY